MTKRILVTGAGGFIGFHLVDRLRKEGNWVRGVDLVLPEYAESFADEFQIADLREYKNCLAATEGIDEVYNLAADMGGIGYITAHLADIARNNTLINVNMLEAARVNKVKKFLFSSSACVYAQNKQQQADVAPLKEEDAYPADPEPGYGWEKLFAEQMCEYYRKDHGLDVRVVRFHNVYGPFGTYDGGKEKSPAALCRKIASADNASSVDIWGDGQQTRSYMYISDCVDGLVRLMHSSCTEPLNLGTDELVTINELFDKISEIAGKTLSKKYDLTKPQGVRGRNSDNTKLFETLRWQPEIKLDQGLQHTYEWIASQVRAKRFYSQFIKPDSLVFDIGANVGDKTKIFRALGSKVIVIEPQNACIGYLTKRFIDDSVVILPAAVGSSEGQGTISIGPAKGISSMSPVWLEAVRRANRFEHIWDRSQDVKITTLCSLISEYGVPDFIKIDVEGYESEVLRGLTHPVKALSFEFHPEHLEDTKLCVRQLMALGDVEFNCSLKENMTFVGEWMTGPDILHSLSKHVGDNLIYGDVYARFK